jgi:hypothetical protein
MNRIAVIPPANLPMCQADREIEAASQGNIAIHRLAAAKPAHFLAANPGGGQSGRCRESAATRVKERRTQH